LCQKFLLDAHVSSACVRLGTPLPQTVTGTIILLRCKSLWRTKYCDDRVCLFVCLSVCLLPYLRNHKAEFRHFCTLLELKNPSITQTICISLWRKVHCMPQSSIFQSQPHQLEIQLSIFNQFQKPRYQLWKKSTVHP